MCNYRLSKHFRSSWTNRSIIQHFQKLSTTTIVLVSGPSKWGTVLVRIWEAFQSFGFVWVWSLDGRAEISRIDQNHSEGNLNRGHVQNAQQWSKCSRDKVKDRKFDGHCEMSPFEWEQRERKRRQRGGKMSQKETCLYHWDHSILQELARWVNSTSQRLPQSCNSASIQEIPLSNRTLPPEFWTGPELAGCQDNLNLDSYQVSRINKMEIYSTHRYK